MYCSKSKVSVVDLQHSGLGFSAHQLTSANHDDGRRYRKIASKSGVPDGAMRATGVSSMT